MLVTLVIVAWNALLHPLSAGGYWEPVAPLPTPDAGVAVAFQDEIYHLGNSVARYSPSVDSWEVLGTSPAGSESSGGLIGDRVYVVQSSVFSYNLTDGSVVSVPDPYSRHDRAAATLNGILYATGGWIDGDSTSVAAVEAYSPSNNSWWTLAPMTIGRKGHETVAMGGQIYAIGGVTGWGFSQVTSTVERYDPATNAWSTVAPFSEARYSFGATAHGETIVIAGGAAAGTYISKSEVYIGSLDEWLPGPDIPLTNYLDNAMASSGGWAYSIGGRKADGTRYDAAFRWDGTDTLAPEVVIVSPLYGDATKENPFLVTGTLQDNTVVDEVEVRVNRGPWDVATGVASWSLLVDLIPGPNIIEARATDHWGNPSGTASVYVTYDLQPPTLSITSPMDGAIVDGGSLTVVGQAVDNDVVAFVETRTNEGDWQMATGTTEWSATVGLAPGANRIEARAFDRVGNPSSVLNVSVTSDVASPSVTILSPADGSVLAVPEVLVTGNAWDDTDVVRVEMVRGIEPIPINGTTAWSARVPLTPGSNPLDVRAVDPTGKVSPNATIVVTYDPSLAPYQVLVQPANASAAPGGSVGVTVSVEGTWSWPIDLSVVGLPPGATSTFSPSLLTGGGQAHLDIGLPADLADRSYTFEIRAASQGAVRSATFTLQVETIHPAESSTPWLIPGSIALVGAAILLAAFALKRRSRRS
jgi:hypothetical protein